MRRTLLICFILYTSLYSSAQAQVPKTLYDEPFPTETEEDWRGIVVPAKTVFGVRFVLDNARLDGLPYEDRLAVDPEIRNNFDGMILRCINEANRRFPKGLSDARSFHFSPIYEGKDYTVTFYVKTVTGAGYTVANVVVFAGGKIALITDLKGKGGKVGSFANLMGDGFGSLGAELADRIDGAVYHGKIKCPTSAAVPSSIGYTYKPLAAEGCSVDYSVVGDNGRLYIVVMVSSDRMMFPEAPTMMTRNFNGEVKTFSGEALTERTSSLYLHGNNISVPIDNVIALARFLIPDEDIGFFQAGIKKIRLTTAPVAHEREFKTDEIGYWLHERLLSEKMKNNDF